MSTPALAEKRGLVVRLGQNGVGQIDVWRSDIDAYAETEPYCFTVLERFLAGHP